MFESFHKFLDRAANVYGVSREIQAAKVCHNFRELLPRLLPQLGANDDPPISPAHFRDGTLTINADSPAWAQEVIMRKPQIIEDLNRKAGRVIIHHLRTQLKNENS